MEPTTYLINGMIFEKKNGREKFVLIFSESFLFFLSIRRDVILNQHRSSCKVPVILARFSWEFNFPNRFSNIPRV